MMKPFSPEKKKVLLANLQTRLNAVTRYSEQPFDDDDIPF